MLRRPKDPSMTLMRSQRAQPVATVIVGAGVAGKMLLDEILRRPEMNYSVRGFVDDNEALWGKNFSGVSVIGPSSDLARLKEELGLEEAIIAMPSVEGRSVRKIVDLCRRAGLATQIVPGAIDVLTGRATVSAARPVSVEDLLRRETVVMSEDVKSHYADRTVLVTGAAGSIGSELCRSLWDLGICRLLPFDIDENGIFDLELGLRASPSSEVPKPDLEPLVGSILHEEKLRWVFETFKPGIVFHTAARKHVPLMELHSEEAVEVNVRGTKLVAEKALEHGAESFVHISTDKAVEPASVMGATKRLSEILIQDFARRTDSTKFVVVRFGNVIGSRGSVLDVFRKQLTEGVPITVTHPEMTRYFMTANEAAVLLLQSVVIGQSGDILVLDMGDPIRVADLARDLITLSGYGREDDVEIRFVGPRRGEKIHERLHAEDETLAPTKHPRIFRVSGGKSTSVALPSIEHLFGVAKRVDRERLLEMLRTILPGYQAELRSGEGA